VRKSILAKHLPYDSGHLGPVLDEMLLCGPPTIRCLRVGEWVFLALEGSHRLAAASALGLAPRLVVVRPEIEEYRSAQDPYRVRVLAELPVWQFGEVLVLDLEEIG
jgi:hypothetical protein